MHTYAFGSLRLMSSIFFSHSLSLIFLSQDLSLYLELINWPGWLVSRPGGLSLVASPVLEFQTYTAVPGFYMDARGMNALDPLAISAALVLILGICDISEWMPDILPLINPLLRVILLLTIILTGIDGESMPYLVAMGGSQMGG